MSAISHQDPFADSSDNVYFEHHNREPRYGRDQNNISVDGQSYRLKSFTPTMETHDTAMFAIWKKQDNTRENGARDIYNPYRRPLSSYYQDDIRDSKLQNSQNDMQSGIYNVPLSDESSYGSDATATAAEPPQTLPASRKYILVLILSVTLFMVALEQTIISAAIPQISASLNSSEGYIWIGTAYLLASCSVLPVSGKLSDIFGRKPILMIGLFFFLLGSGICGGSVSMNMLIAGRAIQGLGCGSIMSLIHIIISDLVPLRERGLFISAVGSVWMVASCTGPLIGGALATAGVWRWCFYINLPVGGVTGIALFIVLKIKSPKNSILDGVKRIDFIGVFLSIGATSLFLLALDWGGVKYKWSSPQIICFIVFGVLTYVLFFFYEAYLAVEPIMPPRLFKTRTRSTAFAASFCHAITFMGIVYYLPFLFQATYGVTAIMSSVYLLPQALLMGTSTALGGVIISKVGRYKDMMQAGLGLSALFLGLFCTWSSDSPVSQRILFPALWGFSVGFNFQSFLIALQTKIRPSDIGTSVSMMLYIRQLGLSASIAIGGVVFQNKITQQAKGSSVILIRKLLIGAAPSGVSALKALPPSVAKIARRMYLESFIYTFYVFIAFSGLGFIICLFIPQNPLNMKKEADKADNKAEQVSNTSSQTNLTQSK